MRILDDSVVGAEEIDELGHLPVRCYLERALRANRALIAELGLELGSGAPLVEFDIHTRYHREQLIGSPLVAYGGVIDAGPHEVRGYYEIRNPRRGEVAATFIIASARVAPSGDERLSWPRIEGARLDSLRAEPPEHGRARTLDLSPPKLELRLDALAHRFPQDPMWSDFEWTVEPDMPEKYDFLTGVGAVMFGLWEAPRGAQLREPEGASFLNDGLRVGWASLETRVVRVSPARLGDRLRSVSTEMAVHRKVRHTRRWLFELTTGRLVRLYDEVNLALDLDARRSIEIPSSIRDRLLGRYTPELA